MFDGRTKVDFEVPLGDQALEAKVGIGRELKDRGRENNRVALWSRLTMRRLCRQSRKMRSVVLSVKRKGNGRERFIVDGSLDIAPVGVKRANETESCEECFDNL